MVQGWVMAWDVVTSVGNGNVWYVGLKDVGPPVLAVTDVLNPWFPFPRHSGAPPAHVAALVPSRVPFPEAKGGNTPVPGPLLVPGLVFGYLGKTPPSKVSRVPPAGTLPGFGAHFSGTVPLSGPLLMQVLVFVPGPPHHAQGTEHMAAPTPAPSAPTLKPSQVSLWNTFDLLSNILVPVEFDRLRKVLDPSSLLLSNHWNPPMINLPWSLLLKCNNKKR